MWHTKRVAIRDCLIAPAKIGSFLIFVSFTMLPLTNAMAETRAGVGGKDITLASTEFFRRKPGVHDQLYDLSADPYEQDNLAHDPFAEEPKHAEILSMMKKELRRHLMQVPGGFGEFKTVD